MGVKVRERPKGSGNYWIFIDYNGKRKAKKIGRNKKLANEMAQQIEAKLTLGEMTLGDNQSVPAFGDYAKSWAAVTVPATCKPSTETDYRGLLRNHILPAFRKTTVNEITKLNVKHFLMGKINDGYAPSTVTHMKNVTSGVLGLAIDDEVISLNPAQGLGKIFGNSKTSPQINPFNREELRTCLDTFKAHFPRDYPLALTLARTGLRLGEALALKWADIDFEGRFITVERGFSRGKIETPKNGKSRKVDMSKQLSVTLAGLKHCRKIEADEKGWDGIPDWIFVTNKGTPLNSSNWRNRVFNKALEKAGLRKIHIHDLRHTFASLLIQNNESLAYVRDQLGHHSIKITVDIYGHLAPEGKKEAVDKLDDD